MMEELTDVKEELPIVKEEVVLEFKPYNADEKELFDYLKPSKLNCSENHLHNDSPFDEIHSCNDSPFDDKSHLHKDFPADELNDFSAVEVKDEKPHINTELNGNHFCNDSPFDDKSHLQEDSSSDEHKDFSPVEVKDEKPDINTEDSFDVKIKPVIEHTFKIELDEFKNEDDGELNEFKNEGDGELNEFKNEGDGELNEFKNEGDGELNEFKSEDNGELNEFKSEDDGDSLGSLTINDHWLGFGSLSSPEQLSGELPNVLGSVTVKSEDDENEEETINTDNQLMMKQPAVLTIQPEEDCEELCWPGNVGIQPIKVVTGGGIPQKCKDVSRHGPTRRTLMVQSSLANRLSFAGIAVPQNIVPCLSPEPRDKNLAPQFFSPATSLPSLFEQTSPVVTATNQVPSENAYIEEERNLPKRRKINESGVDMINGVQSSSQSSDLNFIQEYQQNARRRGTVRGYLEKQIEELRAKLGEYEESPANEEVGTSNTVVVSGSDCTIRPVQVQMNVVKPLTPDISIQTVDENNVVRTKILRTIRKPPQIATRSISKAQQIARSISKAQQIATNFVHIAPRSSGVQIVNNCSNDRPKRARKGKYDTLIERLKVGESLRKDRAELNNLLRIQNQSSTSNLDYLESEIEQIKSRLGINKDAIDSNIGNVKSTSSSSVGSTDGGTSSGDGNQSHFNLNHQVPIVIAPKTSETSQPTYMMGKVLKRVLPNDTSGFAVSKAIPVSIVAGGKNSGKTAESLLTRSDDLMMSRLKNNSQTLKDIRQSTNHHKKRRSSYDSLTRELKNKQVENVQVFEKLKKNYQIAKTDSVDSGSNASMTESAPGLNDSSVSVLDNDDNDNDPRFKDDNYLSSFIKSFQSNPRRYKVYPEATQYKKHYRRGVTHTLPSPRVLNRRVRSTIVLPDFD